VCSGHYIALRLSACKWGGAQARRERRSGLQVPEVLIEASANIAVKAESVRVRALCCRPPCGQATAPSFYRPRRKQFIGVPHCSGYVWRYGAQCSGVDGRPGESGFRRSVVACPVPVQERLRGWRVGVFRGVIVRTLTRGCG
jgi:hypothetical protein